MYEYRAQVLRVHDADTLAVDVDLGFFISHVLTLRLDGLDAPELKTEQGREALTFAKQWLADHATPKGVTTAPIVGVRTIKDHTEKYGRYLAVVYDLESSDQTLNAALLATGHAVPYSGGQRAIHH